MSMVMIIIMEKIMKMKTMMILWRVKYQLDLVECQNMLLLIQNNQYQTKHHFFYFVMTVNLEYFAIGFVIMAIFLISFSFVLWFRLVCLLQRILLMLFLNEILYDNIIFFFFFTVIIIFAYLKIIISLFSFRF